MHMQQQYSLNCGSIATLFLHLSRFEKIFQFFNFYFNSLIEPITQFHHGGFELNLNEVAKQICFILNRISLNGETHYQYYYVTIPASS